MKLYCSLLLLILCCNTKANHYQNKEQFILSIQITGLPKGTFLYLIKASSQDTIFQGIYNEDGLNMRAGVPKGTEYYYLRIDSNITKRRSQEFLLVNSKLLIKGNFKNWPQVELVGSNPNDEYRKFVSLWDTYQNEIGTLDSIRKTYMKQIGLQTELQKKDSIPFYENEIIKNKQLVEDLESKRIISAKHYISANLNSLYIPDVIRRMSKHFSLKSLDSLYCALGTDAKASYFGELLLKDLEYAKKRTLIMEGSIIPNLKFLNEENEISNLHEIIKKSEYTLIDFWASWCKPCRDQIPKLKSIYKKYNKEGFNIVGIALSDQDKAWKNAIEKEGIIWTNVRDQDNSVYKTFDIPAIPGYALVDKNGIMISFSCSGSAIKEFGPQIHGDKLEHTIDSLLKISSKLSTIRTPRTNISPKLESSSIIKPLKIGDNVPDIYLGEIVNHPSLKTASINDFKGKLLILDFWSTWCSVCIAQFPKIGLLQEEFRDQLTILPVGFDARKLGSIKEWLINNSGKATELKLPCAIQTPTDSLLSKYFPFFGLPHEIWIDKDGKLIGITDHRALTSSNIRSVINRKMLSFSEKKITKRIPVEQSFLLNNRDSNITVFGTAITSFSDTLATALTGFVKINNHKTTKLIAQNQTLYALYKYAYSNRIKDIDAISNKRIFANEQFIKCFKDFDVTKAMDNWEYDEFAKRNLFSLEMVFPTSNNFETGYSQMSKSLDAYFGIRSRVIKQKVLCLCLIKLKKNVSLNKNQEEPEIVYYKDGTSNSHEYLQINGDNNIDFFLKQLKYFINPDIIMYNDTGIDGTIKITVKNNHKGFDDIRAQLKRFDLDLVYKMKEIDGLELIKL